MLVYMVRHGQSMGNATNDYSTQQHDRLSPLGWDQARHLVERLADISFTAIYASPLRRTVETIVPLAEARKVTVELWPELCECCWQEPTAPDRAIGWRNGPCEDADHIDPARFRFRDDRALMPLRTETYAEGLNRVHDVAELVKRRHVGTQDQILMVSHGYFLELLIQELMGYEPRRGFCHADNTGLTLIQEHQGAMGIRYINRC